MTKLQIALTDQETANLNLLAFKMGYSLTRFVKFLIGQAAFKVAENVPVYQLSPKAVKTVEEAWGEYKAGRTYSVDSIEELDKIVRKS